jgi:glutamate-1-semialdehyde aminotransferase
VRGHATGLGSLANLHLAERPPRSARDTVDAIAAAGSLGRLLHLGLVRRGVFAASRLMFCCSTPMAEADVDAAATALEDALRELRPLVAVRRPELLR